MNCNDLTMTSHVPHELSFPILHSVVHQQTISYVGRKVGISTSCRTLCKPVLAIFYPQHMNARKKLSHFIRYIILQLVDFWPAQLVITSSAHAPSILSISLGSLSPTKIFSCFLLINYISSSDRWPRGHIKVIVDRTLLNKNLNQQFLTEEL